MYKKFFIACGLILIFSGNIVWAEDLSEGIKVVAEGYSYLGDDTSIKEAQRKAMLEAERAALEQGVPIYLEAYTKVTNYELDKDEIKTHLKGYIKNKKILINELDKEDLKYNVKIEAVVVYSKKDEPETKKDAELDEPVWQPLPQEDSYASEIEIKNTLCKLDAENLNATWNKMEDIHHNDPKRYCLVLELLYPNVHPRRIVSHFEIIRLHNPEKFRRIMQIIFPYRDNIPDLNRHFVQKDVHFQLKKIKSLSPDKYVDILELSLPKFDSEELKRRLSKICKKRPEIAEKIKKIIFNEDNVSHEDIPHTNNGENVRSKEYVPQRNNIPRRKKIPRR